MRSIIEREFTEQTWIRPISTKVLPPSCVCLILVSREKALPSMTMKRVKPGWCVWMHRSTVAKTDDQETSNQPAGLSLSMTPGRTIHNHDDSRPSHCTFNDGLIWRLDSADIFANASRASRGLEKSALHGISFGLNMDQANPVVEMDTRCNSLIEDLLISRIAMVQKFHLAKYILTATTV